MINYEKYLFQYIWVENFYLKHIWLEWHKYGSCKSEIVNNRSFTIGGSKLRKQMKLDKSGAWLTAAPNTDIMDQINSRIHKFSNNIDQGCYKW